MSNHKSKSKQRKNKKLFKSLLPFIVIGVTISGLIGYLWIYSEVDETLQELGIQQIAVVELDDEISKLKDDIEYFSRVDILTARAKKDLGMVFTVPETLAIYTDRSIIVDTND